MKFIAFIMAVLVLTLSCLPCSDVGATSEMSKPEVRDYQSNETQHNDLCSPFCHCTCCAGFSVNHFIALIATIPQYKSKIQAAYLPSNILDVALPIWQPPQLV